MFTDHLTQFMPAACAGFGLFLAGVANLLLLRRGFGVKAAATVAAFGVAVGGAAALGQPGIEAATARFFAIGLAPCLLLSSRRLGTGIAAVFSVAHRPAVRFGLLSVAGIATVVGSILVFEAADEQASFDATAELELTHGRVPSVASERVKALTDRGSPVVVREPTAVRNASDLSSAEDRILTGAHLNNQIIRRGPVDDQSNCHGWVFTGGKFLLSGEDVDLILKENGYQEVQEIQSGDLAVYRQNGTVAHTALVRYVTEGQPVLVEGKWGNLGIFLHPADKSVYGTDYAFYRSARTGHLLVGLGGRSSGDAPPVIAE